MKNFIFKSIDTDLQKIISIYKLLDTIQKNVLYETHQVDKILKILRESKIDTNLQQQVDKYFSDDSENIPEEEQ